MGVGVNYHNTVARIGARVWYRRRTRNGLGQTFDGNVIENLRLVKNIRLVSNEFVRRTFTRYGFFFALHLLVYSFFIQIDFRSSVCLQTVLRPTYRCCIHSYTFNAINIGEFVVIIVFRYHHVYISIILHYIWPDSLLRLFTNFFHLMNA